MISIKIALLLKSKIVNPCSLFIMFYTSLYACLVLRAILGFGIVTFYHIFFDEFPSSYH